MDLDRQPLVMGMAHCEKHGREYRLLNGGSGCSMCQAEQTAYDTINLVKSAKLLAKDSKLIFG